MEARFRSRYGRVAVFRAAAVVFLVCCALIAAVVFTLDLSARRSNDEQAATELRGDVRAGKLDALFMAAALLRLVPSDATPGVVAGAWR